MVVVMDDIVVVMDDIVVVMDGRVLKKHFYINSYVKQCYLG